MFAKTEAIMARSGGKEAYVYTHKSGTLAGFQEEDKFGQGRYKATYVVCMYACRC